MSIQKYMKPPHERHIDDQYESEPLYGHALTVGQLCQLLATFDPDLPVILEGCDCNDYLAGVSLYDEKDSFYATMLWLRRTSTMNRAVPVLKESLELGA